MSALWAWGQDFSHGLTTLEVTAPGAVSGALDHVLDYRPSCGLYMRLLGGQSGQVHVYNPTSFDIPPPKGFVVTWEAVPISPIDEQAALQLSITANGTVAGGLDIAPLTAYGRTTTTNKAASGAVFFRVPTASAPYGIRITIALNDIIGAVIRITHVRACNRLWELSSGVDAQWSLSRRDLTQVRTSPTGQRYYTRVGSPRQAITWSLGGAAQDTEIITPTTTGLRALEEAIGTSEPVWFAPRLDGAMVAEAATFGQVESWPPLEHADGPYWRTPAYTIVQV